MKRDRGVLTLVLLAALMFIECGCTGEIRLIATPTVNLTPAGKAAFDAIPPDRRTPEMEVLYAADRSIVRQTVFGMEYGTGRSGVLSIGVARVDFDPKISWDKLLRLSTSSDLPANRPFLKLTSASESGILAVPLDRMEVRNGRYVLGKEAREKIERGNETLHEMLATRLAKTDRKDVYIFVHGFNNTFADAVIRLAMNWHMAGRPGVAIAYTWPAGRGGVTGYAYDRESGEFTVSHLRRFIRAVAACPEVERIHLIAHSRGTDVAITALRELHIDCRAKNEQTSKVYKLADLVLAAPDMDAEVFEQRFAIEDLHLAVDRTTVYLSPNDFALAVSRWLFGGGNRMGNLRPEDFKPAAREKLALLRGFYLVSCNVSGYSGSHDYAFTHPAVTSDIILLLRDGKPPGAENGRPLRPLFDGVWEINNDYLYPLTPRSNPANNVIPSVARDLH